MSEKTPPHDEPSVKACPQCGLETMHGCWHNDQEVSSVKMLVREAIPLLLGAIDEHLDRVTEQTAALKRYVTILRRHAQGHEVPRA